jgi:hypothetical protein
MYKTANYTAVNNDGILADTTSASFTVTLPASPATGTYVSIVDVTSTFATNPLTVAGNGETLQGLTYTSLVLNVTSAKVDLIYEGLYWAVATTSGTRGYTGSSGVGYTGSASTVVGYTGSLGYVGSQGYDGSAGYTGSVGYAGSSGYTGSLGYTGSAGTNGYTGSLGYSGSGATGVNWTNKSATYTAVNNDGIIANTSGGSFTVTLPASPSTGSYVVFVDGGNSFQAYPLTVAGNGSTIDGSYTSAVLNITNAKVEFIYSGSTWEMATSTGTRGYTGSLGYTGSIGYTGSLGYTGSASTVIGYTGSKGDIGYTGSIPAAITATSLALGGATLGTNNLAVTGNTYISGNLGIGMTPSSYANQNTVAISGTTYGRLDLASAGTVYGSLYAGSGGITLSTGTSLPVMFETSATERARIDTSGNLLVGTTGVTAGLDGKVINVFGSSTVRNIVQTTGQYAVLNLGSGGTSGSPATTAFLLTDGTANTAGVGTGTSTPLLFYTNNTERARIDTSGNFLPGANNSLNLGSATMRWATVYTGDLDLNNGVGNWTIVEGEEDLFIYNNKSDRVYKFNLTEVDPATATPKKE